MIDTNKIIRAYLVANVGIKAFFAPDDPRIYSPRLPENTALPAISFFTRGGTSTPYIPGLPEPSVQFDCWADDPIGARAVYRAIYDALQGIQNVPVVIGADTFYIKLSREEVQGQDLQDVDIPKYFRVLTFFSMMIRGE